MTPPVTLTHAGQVTPVRQATTARVQGAPARYRELELRHRRLLAVLAAHDGEVPTDVLAAAVKVPPKVVFGLMVRLCEVGMAQQTVHGWRLEPCVAPLAKADLNESVFVSLVLPVPDLLRPPCDSTLERRIFAAVVLLFAGCAVVPNVTLSHVVDAEAARPFLGEPALKFLQSRHAELDVVVYGARTLLPILAVEADGPQHDAPVQAGRDRLKDSICRVAALPLLRVRIDARTSVDTLMHRLGRALHEVARAPRVEQRGHQELAEALARLA
ncbi:hypothetical protein DAERI_010068 [Deinococcus aerius]|uniref:DUF2726 domain-containing protein n=1 Tax=Deinococcus aerius TaxID=200253 RepID=A0A2I9D0P6_9DEIO|nr:DUF2726 domain-containing protein [Deinococcus aerius]GBF03896.1 hypothetical protein DAERI_010068 [Deinococcus aerius]